MLPKIPHRIMMFPLLRKDSVMEDARVMEVKRSILDANTQKAEDFRAQRAAEGCLYTDIMASPGAGKTTLLLALIEQLRKQAQIHEEILPKVAVIEADLESDVDSLKIKKANVASVELNTHGVCHVEMGMVERAYQEFDETPYDYLFLENIGNLICPADFDTGSHLRVMLLSVPEGYDKVYKYPPMFAIADAFVVTKSDYLPLNPDFDMEALKREARVLNPNLEIFVVSARTGEGIEELAAWMAQRHAQLC